MPPKDRDRLIRFLAIAGSSASDGEALAALRQAVKLCGAHGLELHVALASAGTAVLDMRRLAELEADAFRRGVASAGADREAAYQRGLREGAAQPGPRYGYGTPGGPGSAAYAAQMAANQGPLGVRTWQDAAAELLGRAQGQLGQKASDFVSGLLARGFATLTVKQDAWLRDLCARFGVAPW